MCGLNLCAMNICCIRKRKSVVCRQCRGGAGTESAPNNAKTPGYCYTQFDNIEKDFRGFYKLSLKRTTSKRMRQMSTILSQSWRANTDIQLIIYNTHPSNPSPHEMCNIIDYCVSYITKTCKAIQIEKLLLMQLTKE